MKKILSTLIILSGLLIGSTAIAADVLLQSYAEGNANNSWTNYHGFGQSFITPNDGNSYYLTTVKLWCKKTGSPTGNAYAELWTHTGSFGNTSKGASPGLATSTPLDISTFGTSYGLVTFTFTDHSYLMSPNTAYWIAYHYPDSNTTIDCGFDDTSASSAGNQSQTTQIPTADSFVWNDRPDTEDLIHYVYGNLQNPAPEITPIIADDALIFE